MKLSNRERGLLGVLVGVALIGGSYFGLIGPQLKDYEALKHKHDEAEIRYLEFKSSLLPTNRIYSDFAVMDNRVKDITSLFFPELRQEKFIALLLDHLKSSGIDPSTIQFSKVPEVTLMKNDASKKTETGLADELVLQYAGSNALKPASAADEAKNKEETDKMLKSVKMQMVTLVFKGKYSDLIALIKQIEAYPRRITVEEISSTENGGELVSTLRLGYYAINKIHKNQDADFMAWTSVLPLGKADPFTGISLVNITKPSSTGATVTLGNDFFMMLNPVASDLTTVVLSKEGDHSRATYVYAENAGSEPVTFELVEKSGKYYYHYKTSGSQYPENYVEPVAFVPKSNVVNLQIFSSVRADKQDKSGIDFTVLNKTNLKLVITVKNDDAKSRITWTKKEGDIQIK